MNLKTITILFAFLILTVIVLADAGLLGFLGFVYSIPYGDKAGHFILYGILSFLLNLTFLRSRPARDPSTSLRKAPLWGRASPKRVAVTVTLILALAIGLEEFSQRFFANRTASLVDLLFGYAGVALGAWLAYKKNLSRNRERG